MRRSLPRTKRAAAAFLLSLTALATAATPRPAGAQALGDAREPRYAVKIGAMSIEDGLKRLQRETGINLVFAPEQVKGLRTKGISGSFTAEDAIRRLLDGSGLEVINNHGAVFVVTALDSPASVPEVREARKPLPPAPQLAMSDVVEEILVPGMRIARGGYEAPTPVTVLGADQIARQATGNLADLVNALPAFAGSQTPNQNIQTASGVAGTNGLSLRDLGIQRTLVLLDGQRSVAGTITGAADVNTFPQQLVSRVDVVTGGASAAYGSDALAGVVNFVLDKTFTGVKGEVSGGMTTYGDNAGFKIAMTAGHRFANDRVHTLLSGEAEYNGGVIHPSNRAWNKSNIGLLANPAYTPTNGEPQLLILDPVNNSRAAPGGLITSGPLKGVAFGPGGVPYQFDYGLLNDGSNMYGSGQAAALNVHATQSLGTRASRQNLFARVSYDLTDHMNVFLQHGWGHADSYSIALLPLYSGNLTVAADNAFIPPAIAARASALSVTSFGFGTINGDLENKSPEVVGDRRTIRTVLGAHGTFDLLDAPWTWDAYLQKGITHHTSALHRVINTARFAMAGDAVRGPTGAIVCRAALTDPGNGCVPYNLFGLGVNSKAALDYITGTDWRSERYEQNVQAFSLHGAPVRNWAGPISVAVGAENRSEKVSGITAPTGWFLGNYTPTFGSYTVTEGFAETVVPLAKDEPWARSVDVNGAVRATSYSTSGYVTTWKLGFTYAPVEDVTFRVTRSRDIRAPNLLELFSGGVSGTNNVINLITTDPTAFIRILSRGNPGLAPEKADTTGLGMMVQPRALPGFNASVNYWRLNIKDSIQFLQGQDVVNYCYRRHQVFCDAITRSYVDGQEQYLINITPLNLARQTVEGFDFEASYRLALSDLSEDLSGGLTLRGLATHNRKNILNNGLNTPVNIAGANEGSSSDSGMPSWRWMASLAYDNGALAAALTARGVSAGTLSNAFIACTSGCPAATIDHPTINVNHIDGAAYVDVSLAYKFKDTASVFLNIQNVADKDPAAVPRINGTPYGYAQTNPILYDILGRIFRAGVRFTL
ncbi:MAG: TonB-dependent receptor [Rhodospirillaceae bacterium]